MLYATRKGGHIPRSGKRYRDMVKCELQVAVANCELFLFCELQVALIVRVISRELHLTCELRFQRKLRVGSSKVRVESKIAICLFPFERIRLSQNKVVFLN